MEYFVSAIVACRNEREFISKCLDSVVNTNYPKNKLEILVIDGKSEDGTREIVKDYAQKYPFVKLLDNPKRIKPFSLNMGIKKAEGEIVMIMDAHTIYKEDYVSKCVEYFNKYDTNCVGPVITTLPRSSNFWDLIIAKIRSHPFGTGNSYFRIGAKKPKWVDAVAFGCYRKKVFEKVGLFNENLARSQDIEFHQRFRKSGEKILLVPEMICYYYLRSDLTSFLNHNFSNGVWAIYPLKFCTLKMSFRHYVPFLFVVSIILSGFLGFITPIFWWLLILILAFYLIVNLSFSLQFAVKERNIKYFLAAPLIFAGLHFNYGLGSLIGLIKATPALSFWKNLIKTF